MNKKGFIRTLEAVIAILIVFVFIYVLMQGSLTSKSKTSDSIKSMEEEILRGISESESLRKEIVNFGKSGSRTEGLLGKDISNLDPSNPSSSVVNYVKTNLPEKFKNNFALVICVDNCGIPSTLPDKEVYTTAIVITSYLESEKYNPKIVRLWVW